MAKMVYFRQIVLKEAVRWQYCSTTIQSHLLRNLIQSELNQCDWSEAYGDILACQGCALGEIKGSPNTLMIMYWTQAAFCML